MHGCVCDYHYQGKPGDWSLLLPLPWGEVSRHWTLHLGQTTCVLLLNMHAVWTTQWNFFFFLHWRSGKPVKAGALMTWQGGASHGAFYSVQPMGDPIWNRQQLTRREWIPQKTPLGGFELVEFTQQLLPSCSDGLTNKNLHSCSVKLDDFYFMMCSSVFFILRWIIWIIRNWRN